MSETKPGVFIFTSPVTLNYGHLFTPRAFTKNGKAAGKERYEADLEIPSESPDLKGMKELAVSIAKSKWPNRDLRSEVAAGTFQMPWQSGDALANKAEAKGKRSRDVSRGKVVLKARSEFKPRLGVIERGSVKDYLDEARSLAKEHFYNGVGVLAQVTFVAYEGVGANPDGVTAYLDVLVSTRKGERIASGGSPSETFSQYAGQFSDEDPTGGHEVEDEISF